MGVGLIDVGVWVVQRPFGNLDRINLDRINLGWEALAMGDVGQSPG